MSGSPTAELCSKCSATLPEGSQFCLKCGQPVAAVSKPSADSPPLLAAVCSKCGTKLPAGAQFCLKCGKSAVSLSKQPTTSQLPAPIDAGTPTLPRRHRRYSLIPWILAVVFVVLFFWIATSDNPFAQNVQEFFGWKRDQAILEEPFSIAPHNFQYFKFDLPEGSVNVSVVGDFTTASDGAQNTTHKSAKDKNQNKDASPDNSVEVFVLTESAFAVWQNGYSTGSLYESGRVSEGKVQADLAPGAGVYYLVFSNKFAPKAAKTIHSTVYLRYRTWLPESIRKIKARVLNLFDL